MVTLSPSALILGVAATAAASVWLTRRAIASQGAPGGAVPDRIPGTDRENYRLILDTLDRSNVLLWWAHVVKRDGKTVWSIRTPPEMVGNSIYKMANLAEKGFLWSPEQTPDHERMNSVADRALADGLGGYQQEFRIQTHNGLRWLSEEVVIRVLGPGEWNLAGVVVDITSKREAEEARRATEAQRDQILMEADCLMWHATVTGDPDREIDWKVFIPTSALYGKIFGVSEKLDADTVTMTREMVPEWDEIQRNSRRALKEDRKGYEQEYHIIRDGKTFLLHESVKIIRLGPNTWNLVGVSVDITKQRRAESVLRESEERFLKAFRALPDPVAICTYEDGRIIEVNESFIRAFGWKRSDLGEGRDVAESFWLRPSRNEFVETLKRGKFDEGLPVVVGDGRGGEHRGLCFVERTEIGGRSHFIAIVRDLTQEERAQIALRESEQRFRQVTENIDEVFWLSDLGRNELIYVSPAFDRIWGRSAQSLKAVSKTWLETIHPSDRERVQAAAENQQTPGAFNIEYRIVRPDGAVRWIYDRAFPIRGEDGKVHRIAGVATDVTVRRHLEEEFRQSQKMDAIGQLAGGIAHDFNNLLVGIQLQSSLLLEQLGDDAESREGLELILASVERAANLTRQLLTFSRRNLSEAREIDLSEVVSGMTKLLRRLLGENIAIECMFSSGLPLVFADPALMEQVLLNLTVNARDAMPDGGRLNISLGQRTVDELHVADHPQASVGSFVCLCVRDSGEGIDPENLSRIFEPFFTTKEVGKGTGLGLATVFGIVQQHSGWIEVESAVGQGSEFRIYLPARQATAVAGERAPMEAGVLGGTERILVVEDDVTVRRLARAVLERYGYTVIECESAASAIEAWNGLEAPVQLLLTDLIMPGGMSGGELAKKFLQAQPGLRVIYSSGYTTEIVRRQLHMESGCYFLQKPYAISDLASCVRKALDSGRGAVAG